MKNKDVFGTFENHCYFRSYEALKTLTQGTCISPTVKNVAVIYFTILFQVVRFVLNPRFHTIYSILKYLIIFI